MAEHKLAHFEREGKAIIEGKAITYRTVCEDYPVHSEGGNVIGTMFTYSYIRTDVKEKANRPVLFAFNGGPGSSAIWIHTGFLAPKRVKLENPIEPPTNPPFELEENPYCMLDICDIVIIDPMGTGFGMIIDEEKQAEAYSVESDAKIFAEFIQSWIMRENRWNSPKYILGESYGTIRATVIPSILMGGPLSAGGVSTGISVDGIIMLGTGITVNPTPNYWDEYGIEPTALALPTMAAVNQFFNGNSQDHTSLVNEAVDFAGGEYLHYMYKGNRMSTQEETCLSDKMMQYTGLSASYLKGRNYRLRLDEFSRELLKEGGRELGMYDARFTLPRVKQMGTPDPVGDDAAMGQYTPAFRGAFMQMAREELGIQLDRAYLIINFNINGLWRYDGAKTPFEYLQSNLRRNSTLRVMVCNGLYDLATTIGQARYTVSHLQGVSQQVIVKEYESGHMSYVGQESAKALCADIRAFVGKEEIKSCF